MELPKFSNIDLEFVKSYLYVDYEEDNALIQLFINSSQEAILFEGGYTGASELDDSKLASVLLMAMVSDMYNSRSTTATDVKMNIHPVYQKLFSQIRGQSPRGYLL